MHDRGRRASSRAAALARPKLPAKRQLIAESERAADERTVVYGTSAKVYQQAFASTAFFGLLFVVIGAVLLVHDEMPSPARFSSALGIMLGIRSAGFARAGKKYQSTWPQKIVLKVNKA